MHYFFKSALRLVKNLPLILSPLVEIENTTRNWDNYNICQGKKYSDLENYYFLFFLSSYRLTVSFTMHVKTFMRGAILFIENRWLLSRFPVSSQALGSFRHYFSHILCLVIKNNLEFLSLHIWGPKFLRDLFYSVEDTTDLGLIFCCV